MLILRIRQAEVATNSGRLDEAFELVTRDSRFPSHRRGQDAITELVDRLVKRAREHLNAGRLAQAGADCEKAGKLGGSLPELVDLQAELRTAHEGMNRAQRDAAAAVAAARRCVAEGDLSIGQRLIAGVQDSRARRLMTDIDDHRARLDAALAVGRAAVDRRDWSAAAEAVGRARGIAPGDAPVAELATEVAKPLADDASSQFAAGRLDRASEAVRWLRVVDNDSPIASDITRALEHCRSAWELLAVANPHGAAEQLRRVIALFPKTSWITEAMKHVDAAEQALSELRSGPLSLAGATESAPRPSREWQASGPPRPRPPAIAAAARDVLPDRFILQVDGAGAFLVVRSAAVKVGPISSTALPDVALIADATAPAVTIERTEDDYFLRSPTPVGVNEKPVTEALLTTGDRVSLSPRCRFGFALPNAASTTAVLDLSGARYPRADVRRVILLDRDLILGAGPASHVRVPGLAQNLVLKLHGGALRPSTEAAVNGNPLSREESLPLGVPISAGGATFVLGKV